MNYSNTLIAVRQLDQMFAKTEADLRACAGEDTSKLPQCRFRFLVRVVTEEGSVHDWENAYAFWLDGWFCVVPEHGVAEMWPKDEMLHHGVYERTNELDHTVYYGNTCCPAAKIKLHDPDSAE